MIIFSRISTPLCLVILLSCVFSATPAIALDPDWRQQAKAYLEEGKDGPAIFLVKQASDAVAQQSDMVERVNMLRYIGELSWMTGDQNAAKHQFHEAMRYAMKMPEPWKRLATVISVCELHQKAVATPLLQRELMEPPLSGKLLGYAATDAQASEIGRYIRCFDAAADTTIVSTLLSQIHLIARDDIRKKALHAMTEIDFDLVDSHFLNLQAKPHHRADTLEKILWYVVTSRLFNTRTSHARSAEYKQLAIDLMKSLPKTEQGRAKKIIATLD